MTSDEASTLAKIVDFVRGSDENYYFPTGGVIEIPSDQELYLIEPFLKGFTPTAEFTLSARESLTRSEAYSLVVFAVRMAILAVRTGRTEILEASLWAACIDDSVDWRDILVAFAILEDCWSHLGCDFVVSLKRCTGLASERRRNTIEQGYLPRSREMRAVETMGYKRIKGANGSLTYVKL